MTDEKKDEEKTTIKELSFMQTCAQAIATALAGSAREVPLLIFMLALLYLVYSISLNGIIIKLHPDTIRELKSAAPAKVATTTTKTEAKIIAAKVQK